MVDMTADKLAGYFDHTQLRAYALEEDFFKLCDEARAYGFAMVAINPAPVALCKERLLGSGVHVGAAISFPLGQLTIPQKVSQTRSALVDGADEIDYVVNITQLKLRRRDYVRQEMQAIVQVCREKGAICKVILETCYLTDDEKRAVCDIALETGIDYVKTSTGFGAGGATVEDVRLMKQAVGSKVKVKASGGVRTLEDALAMIAAGAERIGSSASVQIVEAFKARGGSH